MKNGFLKRAWSPSWYLERESAGLCIARGGACLRQNCQAAAKSWMRWQYFQKLDDKTIFSKVGWRDNIFLTLSFAIAGSAFARLIFRFLNSLPYLPLTPGCVLHKYDQLGCPCKFFPQLLSGWRAWIFFSWMQENSVKDPACLKESFSRHVAGTQKRENNGGNVFGQRGSTEARRTSLTAPTFGRCSHNNRSDAWIPICSRKGDMRSIDIS